MENIIGLIGILFTMFGGLAWLLMMLGNLKGRLDTLEGKKHFERAEQEFTQKLEIMLEAAQQRLNNELNPERILQKIETAQQQAVQQIEELQSNLSGVETALQELEVAKQRALDEITQASSLEQLSTQFLVKMQKQLVDLEQQRKQVISEIAKLKNDALEELKQEVEKLKQSVVQPSDPITALAETLPEITFETAFIDDNKNIRRETRKARQLVETLPNNVKLEMIYVPGGTFMMGSNDGAEDEKPAHPVTLKPFFVGKYPVTQAQWEAIMGSNPSKFKGANRPVETVTWNDAMQCCAKLSQLTGYHYRLLSEAQWEYACRAGSVTKYSFGEIITPALANYDASGIKQTTDVGKYPANVFGLYDMHGNVWEWCGDVWHENYVGAPSDGNAWMAGRDSNRHLLRGCSWYNNDNLLRCAYRYWYDSTSGNNYWGFRISRVNL